MSETIKDFVGQDAKVGDYFAYALVVGRSASQAIYQLREILPEGKVRAHKIDESYGFNNTWKYKKCEYDKQLGEYRYRDMTEV